MAWSALATIVVGALWALEHFASATIVPDVEGLTVEQAAIELHEAGIALDADGLEGTVTEQHPAAGAQWFRYEAFEVVYVNDTGTHILSKD